MNKAIDYYKLTPSLSSEAKAKRREYLDTIAPRIAALIKQIKTGEVK